MYVITRKSIDGEFDMFYQFSGSKNDLYCVATDNLQTCKKYSEEEYLKLRNNKLLDIRGVSFKKVYFHF